MLRKEVLMFVEVALLIFIAGVSSAPQGGAQLSLIFKDEERHTHVLDFNQPKNQSLANGYLPVYSAVKDDSKASKIGFEKIPIMHEIGPFATYFSKESKSALVYFNKSDNYMGMIDDRYYVDHFSPKSFNNILDVANHEVIHVHQSPKFHHRDGKAMKHGGNQNSAVPKVTLYPEILVVISHDFMQKAENRDSEIVKYVITYFNSVDSIFSILDSKDVKIRINIAGIVLEKDAGVFPRKVGQFEEFDIIHPEESMEMLGDAFYKSQDSISRSSYDFIVYFTSHYLVDDSSAYTGLTTIVDHGPINVYAEEEKKQKVLPIIVISENEIIAETVIHCAYSLAAMMEVEDDDSDKVSIMSPHFNAFKGAEDLKWSEKSVQEFEDFIRSKRHCDLINKPRSLSPGHHVETLSADEQCACYGYPKSFYTDYVASKMCSEHLRCKSESGEEILSKDLPRPMDGTPCAKDSVCHNKECHAKN